MKIALLSAASSIHSIRWANGLSREGVQVYLISQHPLIDGLHQQVTPYIFPFRGRAGYFLMAPKVRKLLDQLQPELANAHYASGYGTTAHLVNYHPWLLSVWGSDVYDFPITSSLHHWCIASNLKAADAVASTSYCMSEQIRRIAPQLGDIAITPFGVDCSQFYPMVQAARSPDAPIVIGTVKTLAHTYGIDLLIAAFALARQRLSHTNAALAARLKLRIVGGGPDRAALQKWAAQRHVADVADFVGPVPHALVPGELSKMDIFAALSRWESFGVAAIEASALGLPVVVSDAGGLPEVVLHGQTGLVVPKENPHAAADALLQLIQNTSLRGRLGSAGREHVLAHYSWDASVKNMISVYERMISKHKTSCIVL